VSADKKPEDVQQLRDVDAQEVWNTEVPPLGAPVHNGGWRSHSVAGAQPMHYVAVLKRSVAAGDDLNHIMCKIMCKSLHSYEGDLPSSLTSLLCRGIAARPIFDELTSCFD
jgi:hypothetical protein